MMHRWAATLALVLLAAPASAMPEDKFALQRTIYQEKSLYRNILVVESEDGYRCMKFGRLHARQTCIHLAQPQRLVLNYTKGLLAALYMAPTPRRVLIIGLGGGVLPMTLRALDAQLEIDTVELDPAVVKVARSHFRYQEDARVRTHVQDARVFVRQQLRHAAQYDMVLVDAFDRDYIPEHLLTREFLQQLHRLLTPSGVLAANTFTAGALSRHEAATYQAVFGQLYQLELAGGNRILLARRDGLPAWAQVQQQAHHWEAQLASWGVLSAQLLPRFRLQASAAGVRVLTDQYSPSNLLLP
ncbi:MAG: fused MFS/spermidine synthase [Giesbergeria sp.]|uniref:spermidine synthase n=1 Tax=Giesbergeria sp. TaxID=2818473 RepID=UPI00261B3AEC|nr:fused MFS/spermidine synthase [Giesbergeria sp.]MDD2608422.1 fused MFS/spermidine synthase [Giesbergeria sp.]